MGRLKNPLAAPAVLEAMMALQKVVNGSRLDTKLMELVRMRASQINRCARCLDMHLDMARKHGETDQRLFLLDAWEEVPDLYTPRERAALLWTEALTRLPDAPVSDEVFEAASAEFSEPELLELTLAVVAINGWNRFNVGFRIPPGAR